MKRRLLFAGSLIAVAAIGFAVGFLVQSQLQWGSASAIRELAAGLSVFDPDAPPAPPIDQLQYPDSKRLGSGSGMKTVINGVLVWPESRYELATTSDEFADVMRHFAQQMQFQEPEQIASSLAGQGSESSIHGSFGDTVADDKGQVSADNFYISDNLVPGEGQIERPLKSKCLVRRTASYDLTVFVTRASDEAQTHILLIYTAKKLSND